MQNTISTGASYDHNNEKQRDWFLQRRCMVLHHDIPREVVAGHEGNCVLSVLLWASRSWELESEQEGKKIAYVKEFFLFWLRWEKSKRILWSFPDGPLTQGLVMSSENEKRWARD